MNVLNKFWGGAEPVDQPLKIVGNAELADSEMFRDNDRSLEPMYGGKLENMFYRFAGENSDDALKRMNVNDVTDGGWLPATIKWEDKGKVARYLGIREDLSDLDSRISRAVGIPSVDDGVIVVPYGNCGFPLRQLKFEAKFEQPAQRKIHVTVNYDKTLSACAGVARHQYWFYKYSEIPLSLEEMYCRVKYLDVEAPPLHRLPE